MNIDPTVPGGRWAGLARRLRAAARPAAEPRVRLLGQVVLAGWFVALSTYRIWGLIGRKVPAGVDVQIYYRGVEKWFHGGDPWSATVQVGSGHLDYAGSPATTLVMAPSLLLSEAQFVAIWMALTALSAVFILRRLKLPLWWLAFPPMAEGLYSGNPNMVLVALLLVGAGPAGAVASSVAVALKPFAVFPLLAEIRPTRRLREIRVRPLVYAVSLTLATMILVPALWISYAQQFGAISDRLRVESAGGWSAFYNLPLLVPTALAIVVLWRLDPKAAAWLVVPALWPSTEFHYSVMALPVITAPMAALLALPPRLWPPIVIILYTAWRVAGPRIRTKTRTALGLGPVEDEPPAPAASKPLSRPESG